MRFLIDTNIFIDYISEREGSQDSIDFLRFAIKTHKEMYITSMSVRDIGYTIHHITHSKEKASKAQWAVYQMTKKIIDITADDVINSLYGDMDDFEDSLLAESCERNFIDVIVTNNIKDYEKSRVPAFTPKELLRIYQNIEQKTA